MTRKQAEFIADRVPGAKVFLVGRASYVYVPVTDEFEIRMYSSAAGPEIVVLNGRRNFHINASLAALLLAVTSEIAHALADARAAGILPQEGEVADDE